MLMLKLLPYLDKNNDIKIAVLGPIKTNISRNLNAPTGLAKLIYNFLIADPNKLTNNINKFLIKKNKIFYYTKTSIVVYYLIKFLILLFPNIYKGGKNKK